MGKTQKEIRHVYYMARKESGIDFHFMAFRGKDDDIIDYLKSIEKRSMSNDIKQALREHIEKGRK